MAWHRRGRPNGDHGDLTAALAWAESVAGHITSVRSLAGGWTSTMLALAREAGDEIVLRLMTRDPWRPHGRALTTRESRIQQMLTSTRIPAPRSLALDAEGLECGHPAHLMSLVPGGVRHDCSDAATLGPLADVLAAIHAVQPTIGVREYQSWAFEAKYQAPPWAGDPSLWDDAFGLLRSEPPHYQPCFIHRDFQPRNVLWSEGRVSGVVDWVETSIGPAWLDVAHCSTAIAISHGIGPADAFAAAYSARTGREPQPYSDVMDVVGCLPLPGRDCFVQGPGEPARLEQRLRLVLQRVDGRP
jgi:aminoglycoside phosphotransferase (APT) family kinase protein